MTDWLIIHRGEAEQIPLVFIPGWGFSGAAFKDHPAFAGETLIVSTGFTSADMVQDLADFLEQQQVGKVRIVGWSMGGSIGVDFAVQHPERVFSLTLVAVRHRWHAEDIDLTRQELFHAAGVGIEKFYRKCFFGAKADYQQFATHLASSVENCDVDLLDKGLTYLANHRMPDSLPLPVHIIQGGKDVICPVDEMAHFSTKAHVTILAMAGHFLFSHADFKI